MEAPERSIGLIICSGCGAEIFFSVPTIPHRYECPNCRRKDFKIGINLLNGYYYFVNFKTSNVFPKEPAVEISIRSKNEFNRMDRKV